MMGWPNEGASLRRTVRGTMLWHTLSPKWSRTSRTTWSANLVRGVVHDEDHGAQLEPGIEIALDELHVAQQLAQPSSA